MFELTLFDHLRLTFGHLVLRQKAHADIARSRARSSRALRAAEALSTLGVVITSVAAAAGKGNAFTIASAVFGSIALAALLVHVSFDVDRSAQEHASCAVRLWQTREKYRSVLSDLRDGAIDPETARRRRDLLVDELHDIFEHAPLADPEAYRPGDAGAAVEEAALTDEQIDLFLPKSLHSPRPYSAES
jgi:SMODS and SLOG-associating 2TM effector domain family 4